MHFAAFRTMAPLGHLQRALDELNRAGFDLATVQVSRTPQGDPDAEGLVRIDFHAAGTIAPETYLHRLAGMAGILSVEGGPSEGTTP